MCLLLKIKINVEDVGKFKQDLYFKDLFILPISMESVNIYRNIILKVLFLCCRAFSTTETVESMYAISHNVTPPQLSVQEVIDCSVGNDGCSGGNTCTALAWLNNVCLICQNRFSFLRYINFFIIYHFSNTVICTLCVISCMYMYFILEMKNDTCIKKKDVNLWHVKHCTI